MGDAAAMCKQQMELVGAIGFEGDVLGGLRVHPDGRHLVYGLGTDLVVLERGSRQQRFLKGHCHNVSCLDVSRSGRYIASGQLNFMGFNSEMIVWDYVNMCRFGAHQLHKVKVEAVAFSADDKYVASLGGQDDGKIIIFDMETREPLCGSRASTGIQGISMVLKFCNTDNECFITAGDYTLRVWRIHQKRRVITPVNVNISEVKRQIRCATLDACDQFLYCGTTSGDILKVRMTRDEEQPPSLMACLARVPEKRDKRKREGEAYALGIWSILMLPNNELLVGTGTGRIARLKISPQAPSHTIRLMRRITDRLLEEVQRTDVEGRVTSLVADSAGQVYVGTGAAHIYSVCPRSLSVQLLQTCHPAEIKAVTFPNCGGELFATCGHEDARVWHTSSGRELLRVTVPNMTCQCLAVTDDGTAIVTGWSDGIVRGYHPESGQLKFTIRDAHNRGVTAVAPLSTGLVLITGGGEGQVRAWEIGCQKQPLLAAMKEHRGSVTCVRITKDDSECVSSCTDGSCIIWDVCRFTRKTVLMASTLFMGVCYHPSETQLVTCGTDRKLAYWEIFDGSLIRELEAAENGGLNAVDITADGKYIVTGGDDKLVKVYRYSEGDWVMVGKGHSTSISGIKISPDGSTVVSVGTDGAILIWRMPAECCPDAPQCS